MVNKHLLQREEERKGNEEVGYIMEILDNEQLVVRPELHCPEIDSYDEISLEQVTGVFEDKEELDIGDKISYIV